MGNKLIKRSDKEKRDKKDKKKDKKGGDTTPRSAVEPPKTSPKAKETAKPKDMKKFKPDSIPFKDVKGYLNENFVSKLLAYLLGEAQGVCTHQQFMHCYELVMHHCNMEDNSKVMHIFEDLVKDYIEKNVKGVLNGVDQEHLLLNLLQAWDAVVIYASSMDRLFQYLNTNYLKNTQRPQISEQVLILFKKFGFDKHEQRIVSALLE